MTVHNRKIKTIEFALGANSFECQVQTWQVVNNTPTGEKMYGQCPEGEFREEVDPDYALELTFWADWTAAGVSDYLTANDQTWVAFTLDHHPSVAAEHVQWSGTCQIVAPNAGGEARATEQTTVTLPIQGKPVYTRVGA